jgi:hypothetical protein
VEAQREEIKARYTKIRGLIFAHFGPKKAWPRHLFGDA